MSKVAFGNAYTVTVINYKSHYKKQQCDMEFTQSGQQVFKGKTKT